MITEDYVSFETAKLLKEKGFGFDAYVRSYYEKDKYRTKEEFSTNNELWNYNISRFRYSAPTLQMAMKWLREVHHIAISLYVFNRDLPIEEDNIIYTCDIATANMSSKEGHLRLAGSYEQVCEAAIKYCLENLI